MATIEVKDGLAVRVERRVFDKLGAEIGTVQALDEAAATIRAAARFLERYHGPAAVDALLHDEADAVIARAAEGLAVAPGRAEVLRAPLPTPPPQGGRGQNGGFASAPRPSGGRGRFAGFVWGRR